MIEKLLDLEDISLIPVNNNGNRGSKYNFAICDEFDKTLSYPIFTSPLDSITDVSNCKMWAENGIRPILPRTIDIQTRLNYCQFIFVAFTLFEVKEHFITRGKRNSSNQFRICIDEENGHNIDIFNTSMQLKQIYGNQIIIMGGLLGNAKSYPDYCKANIDFVRVGLYNSCLMGVSRGKYGFYNPIASLLIDICGVKQTSCLGLKHTKIIADGSIASPIDIMKAIALGADYVMCGSAFVKLLESAGTIYKKDIVQDKIEEITREEAYNIIKEKGIRGSNLKRIYMGEFDGTLATELSITQTLNDWINKDFLQTASYGFTMTNATDWNTYKSNVKYGRTGE